MDFLQQAPLTANYNAEVLAAGTTTTLSSTNAFSYSIDGFLYAKAALSNTATPTTDKNTGVAFVGIAAGFCSIFAVLLNAAGTLAVVQGQVQAIDVANSPIFLPQLPAIPAGYVPVGLIGVSVKPTGATWTFGSSNLSGATNTVYSFIDVGTYPSRPPQFNLLGVGGFVDNLS